MKDMEYIDLRKVGREGLKEIRRQVVRLKELGKTGKEIEELTGVRQNRASEIWTAYQREGSASLERKKYGRKPGSHMVLTPEEQENVRKTIVERVPKEFGITGRLWTLGRTREYIQKEFHKTISERTLSDYMKRWGMSCQRPVKRARRQNPQGI
jgi:transposase